MNSNPKKFKRLAVFSKMQKVRILVCSTTYHNFASNSINKYSSKVLFIGQIVVSRVNAFQASSNTYAQ